MRNSIFFVAAVFFCFVLVKFSVPAMAQSENIQKPISWAAYQNKRLGFTIYYPADWFTPDPEPAEKDGRTFTSEDGKARIAAFGMLDPKWLGAELYDKKRIIADGRVDDALAINLYRGALREEGSAYENVIEKKVEKNWLTITGTRGDETYFEKYIFSCKDKVISAMALNYPTAQEAKYKLIIKTLIRRFGAGSGSDTPRCL